MCSFIVIEKTLNSKRFILSVAVGGADAVVSIWDARELLSARAITRLEWPIRSVSFSHDGLLLATGTLLLLILK